MIYKKIVLDINKKIFGPRLRKNAAALETCLLGLNEEELEAISKVTEGVYFQIEQNESVCV